MSSVEAESQLYGLHVEGARGDGVPLDGLRLALVSDTYAPQLNGVTRTLERLVRAVESRGGEARVFTTTDPRAEPDPKVHRSGSIPFWAYPQLRLAVPAADGLAQEMSKWGADLVHAATPFGMGLAARRAARMANLPFVTSYHTSFSAYAHFYQLGLLSAPGWRFLRWFHNGGARTFCPTTAVSRELEGHGFERTAVWGRGVNTKDFAPSWRSYEIRRSYGLADTEFVVVYVGRLAREKGLDVLLDAMSRLSTMTDAPPCRLLMVGDGPYAAECRRRAGERAVFVGQRSGPELSRLFASADLFVFPSTTDTFGNVLLEAMASALPVAAADCPVTRELLSGARSSFFAAGDSVGLARQIANWGRDPGERRLAGRAGRALAEGRTWALIFDDLFREYRGVVRRHRAERATAR